MSLEEKQERLKEDPETVHIDFAGEERPFLLSTLGMERARQKKDPIPILFDLIRRYSYLIEKIESLDELGEDEVQDHLNGTVKGSDLSDLSVLLWSGFLTFDADVDLEEVQLVMTPGRVFKSGKEVARALMSFLRDMDEEAVQNVEDVSVDGGEEEGN